MQLTELYDNKNNECSHKVKCGILGIVKNYNYR